jgi:hypothetical protein
LLLLQNGGEAQNSFLTVLRSVFMGKSLGQIRREVWKMMLTPYFEKVELLPNQQFI